MEEKKQIKIGIKTFFIFFVVEILILITVLIVVGELADANSEILTKIENLEKNERELKYEVIELSENADSKEVEKEVESEAENEKVKTDKNVEQDEKEKTIMDYKKMYEKVAFSNMFLALLTNVENKTFSDDDIINLLVEITDKLESEKIFKDDSSSEGFFVKAKLEDVQKYAKKYFGRELKSIQGDFVKKEIPSGFGIIEFKFIRGGELKNGDSYIIFEEMNLESSGSLTYGISYEYDEKNDVVIYKGFTNDIIILEQNKK